jgi:sugar lactone lactonase YvrE
VPNAGLALQKRGSVMPATSEWSVVVDSHDLLGEGPWWDARTGTLLWVDIDGRRLARHDPSSGRTTVRDLDQRSSAVMGRSTGGLALAMEDGVWVADSDIGPLRRAASIESDDPRTRMNDATCDRVGRLWVGSTAHDARPGAGSLYRVDPDGCVERVLADVTISNGIDWSPDDRRMYFIDSATRRVDVLDYDLATGRPSGRRALIQLPEDAGLPDGMSVDAEGYLWVALWDGWSVRRYSPTGDLDRIVQLPVARVTSCAFGGPDLADLYVTSASTGLNAAELAGQPLAGDLFVVQPGVRGLEATPFGG